MEERCVPQHIGRVATTEIRHRCTHGLRCETSISSANVQRLVSILVIVFFLIVRLLADHLQAANRATFHRRHSRRARLGFVIIDFGGIRRVETLLDEISAFWLFHDSLQLGRRKRVHQTRLRHHQKQHLRTGQRRQLVCFLHDTSLAFAEGDVATRIIVNKLNLDLSAPCSTIFLAFSHRPLLSTRTRRCIVVVVVMVMIRIRRRRISRGRGYRGHGRMTGQIALLPVHRHTCLRHTSLRRRYRGLRARYLRQRHGCFITWRLCFDGLRLARIPSILAGE